VITQVAATSDSCLVQRTGRRAIVTLPQHVGETNVGQIREELLRVIDRGATELVIDMTGTVSCDYEGTAAVARAHQRAAASGTQLRLVVTAEADLEDARTLLREIGEVLRRRPGLGTLAGQARAFRDQLSDERGSNTPGASALTAAELRLLPMLCTHLSFPEIGAEMFLSRYTVKSHAYSIYRKLGASSRSQAVTRARDLGLLEP
jgi:ATP/maltotriose-dependent transcriptional regulator MalT